MTDFNSLWSFSKTRVTDLISDPSLPWQIGILLVAFGIGWLAQQFIGKRAKNNQADTQDVPDSPISRLKAVRYIVLPLATLVFLYFARYSIDKIGSTALIDFAIALLCAVTLVRLIIYTLLITFPQRWRWIITFQRSLNFVVWTVLIVYLSGFGSFVAEKLEAFPIGNKQQINLWLIINGLFTVGFFLLVALWIANAIAARLRNADYLDSSLRVVLIRIVQSIFVLIAIFSGLLAVGVDITALSVFSGALGVGIGIGFQKVASNYISGFIILLDRSIRIGNLVSIDSHTNGIVAQITTRYTVVRNSNGTEYIVPNETLVTNIVQNQSWSDNSIRMSLKIQVAYDSDIEKALNIMEEAARNNTRVMASPAPFAMLTDFGDNGINLELGFWISDPRAGTGLVRSQVNMAIWQAFREAGITFPFPQREVRIIGGAHDETVPLSMQRNSE